MNWTRAGVAISALLSSRVIPLGNASQSVTYQAVTASEFPQANSYASLNIDSSANCFGVLAAGTCYTVKDHAMNGGQVSVRCKLNSQGALLYKALSISGVSGGADSCWFTPPGNGVGLGRLVLSAHRQMDDIVVYFEITAIKLT